MSSFSASFGPALAAHADAGPQPRVCCATAEVSAPLAAAWERLSAHAAEPNPFCEPWFVAAALRHIGEDAVRLVQVWRGERLIGILPVVARPSYYRLPVRHVQSWRHGECFLGTPLVAQGEEQAFWSAALDALDQADWAPGFLHLRDLAEDGPVHRGLEATARERKRPLAVAHRSVRAMLAAGLPPDDYFERNVRKKKRKELARLRSRLSDCGALAVRELGDGDDLDAWCGDYLALESAGWKGRTSAAMVSAAAREAFFREALAGARAAGRLDFLRLDLDGRPLAMLVNFLCPPGGFAYKTTFDERFARFSPGVLLQVDNLQLLRRPDLDFVDSCAAPDHPMIDHLWAERRNLVRLNIALKGTRRAAAFASVRALENVSAWRRAGAGR